MAAEQKVFEGWAILELMGHRRLAGYVHEVEVAGAGMLRLDVPEHPWNDGCTCGSVDETGLDHEMHAPTCHLYSDPADQAPADVRATQFYSPAAVYCLTPTTEAIARTLSKPPTPAHEWELQRPALPRPALPAPDEPAVYHDADADAADPDELEEESEPPAHPDIPL